MTQVSVNATNFAGALANVNGPNVLQVSRAELVRAAICAGYPNWSRAFSPTSYQRAWAVLFRASIVLAYVEPTANGFQPTAEYLNADRSEKGALSYFFGLFAAKIAADRLFGVPFLLHYDAYRRDVFGVGPIGRSPDFIGTNGAGLWIVVEAKGRSGGTYPIELLTDAKAQAATVSAIVDSGTSTPVTANIGSVAWFPKSGLSIRLDDPPAESEPLNLVGDVTDVFVRYYEPIVDFVARNEPSDVVLAGLPYKEAYDASLDLHVAMSSALITHGGREFLRSKDALLSSIRSEVGGGEHAGRTASFESALTATDERGRAWSVGVDGIAVLLGARWDTA